MAYYLTNSKSTNGGDAGKSNEKFLPDLEQLSVSMSSASQVANSIDLLIDILKRLPVKSVLMFKSVSKHWLSLISESHFVNKHFIQNPQLSVAGLFALPPSLCSSDGEFFFLDGRKGIRSCSGSGAINSCERLSYLNSLVPEMKILQSCNGLLLCQSGKIQGLDMPDNLNYHIYNPCTKQCKTLSSLPRFPFNFSTPIYYISVSLAFDPLKSPHYKLVWMWKDGRSFDLICCFQIHIYSSETDTWRLSKYQLEASKYIDQKSGVFWNGSLNWLTNFVYADYTYCYIIDQELVKRVPLPSIRDRRHDRDNMYFGECTGHLYFIQSYDTWITGLDILELETDFSAWNVKYCVSLRELPSAFPETSKDLFSIFIVVFTGSLIFEGFRILLVQEEEEDHLNLVLQITGGKVVSYNTKDMNFKEIHSLGSKFSRDRAIVYQFIESLAHV